MSETRTQPLVSIVVPIFNAEPFLDETIRSVLAQSYSDWELLLVDDASTDGSRVIMDRFRNVDPERIRCLQHYRSRNLGVCATRNLGIRQSRGRFIAFLDADDLWLPNQLQQQVACMQAHPTAGLAYGRSIYFEDGAPESSQHVPELAPGGKLYHPPELLRLNYPLGHAGAPCPSSFLARVDALQAIGGFEESFDWANPYEDQAFLAKMYLHAPVFVANECWGKYRSHPQSCWQRALRAGTEESSREIYLKWLRRYLQSHDVNHPEIRSLLRRRTWPYRHPVLARAGRLARGTANRVLRKRVSS